MKTLAIIIFLLNIAVITIMVIAMPYDAQDRYAARVTSGICADWTRIYLGRLCWFGALSMIDLAYIVLRLGLTLPKPSDK